MKFIAILLMVFSIGCQTSHVTVKESGNPVVELDCTNLGDTEFQIDYLNITISCYGGKLSKQASELVTDVFSAIVSAIVPVGAISAGVNAVFKGDEE